MSYVKGVEKKSGFLKITDKTVSPATNMLDSLERWDPQLCLEYKNFSVRYQVPRYKQIKMVHQISKFLNVGQSSVLKSDVPYCFTYISAPLC